MLREINELRTAKVEKIVEECKTMKSIFFKDKLLGKANPGQFAMIWIPNYNEMPMSISYANDNLVGITVKPIGKGTSALFNLKEGDLIKARGPYGKPFSVKNNALIVGGGIGLAPLLLLAEKMSGIDDFTIILAAKSKDELPYVKRMKRIKNCKVIFSTEDGSLGLKGIATEIACNELRKKRFSVIYTCGPEVMMRKLYDLSKKFNLEFEASLERYVKCGFGICGSCAIGKYLVCKDGPVFTKSMLSQVKNEFGIFTRSSSGRAIKF